MVSEWISCTVADLITRGEAELKTGPFGTQLHASDYVECGVPVINVRNIGFGNVREEQLEFIASETVSRLASHLLKPNDIVFGRKGAVERHAFILLKYDGWFQGSDCLRLRVSSPEIEPRFLSYCFLTERHKRWMINQCSHGATMASLNQDIISRIPLCLPPLPIQRKIAAILSAYDDLIENNTRRIALLEAMAQALYREWFVHFRYPDHEGTPLVDSPLGPIPHGWQVAAFSEVADFVNGFAFAPQHWGTSGLPIVKIAELKDGITSKTPYCDPERVPSKYLIRDGDLLFSWSADLDAYVWASGPALLNQHLFNVVPRPGFSRTFLYHALKNRMLEFKVRSQGTTMRHIKRSALDEVKFVISSPELQAAFESHAQPILWKARFLNQANANLRRQRDLLLPKLVSGELDVSALEIAACEEGA